MAGRWDPTADSGNGAWVIDFCPDEPATYCNHSPCIDAGHPDTEITDEPVPNANLVNMGCYGTTSQASKSWNRADFNDNGTVEWADFGIFAESWQWGN